MFFMSNVLTMIRDEIEMRSDIFYWIIRICWLNDFRVIIYRIYNSILSTIQQIMNNRIRSYYKAKKLCYVTRICDWKLEIARRITNIISNIVWQRTWKWIFIQIVSTSGLYQNTWATKLHNKVQNTDSKIIFRLCKNIQISFLNQ